jgi:ubiquinone/menaquinone biosynthesis C-methylase UbiE
MPEILKTAGLSGRPGGFSLTDRAIKLGGFRPGMKILDLGCGEGYTVEYLREKLGLDATGLDKNISCGTENPGIQNAKAEAIPLPDAGMDGILMECSFSLTDDPEKVLSECHRILKPGGKLIISDMYARGEPAMLTGCLGRLESREYLLTLFEKSHFKPEVFEDHTQLLQAMWGQMIFDQGAEQFYCNLGIDPAELKRIKCGYYLMMAKKIH